MSKNIKMSLQETLQFKDIKSKNQDDKERLNCVYQHAINEGYKQGIIKGDVIGYEKGFDTGFEKGFDTGFEKGQNISEKRLLYEHMINYYQNGGKQTTYTPPNKTFTKDDPFSTFSKMFNA